jgi:hypothetical protein
VFSQASVAGAKRYADLYWSFTGFGKPVFRRFRYDFARISLGYGSVAKFPTEIQ